MGLDVAARDLVVGGRARAPAIAGLSLDIAGGERVALIGPSGAGKSTLLRALAAAERPREGTLRLAGLDPWTLPGGALARLRRRSHLAPQTPPLPPRQRVATAVLAGRLPSRPARYALRLFVGVPDAEAALAHAALASVGLGTRLWDRVDRLSGGERQRVALARALVADAEALFVDEPLAALDPSLAGRALARLLEHAANTGATLLCSLHQVELARTAFPRVLAIRDGRTFFDGPSAALDDALVARLYAGHEEELDTLRRGARSGATDGAATEATDGARHDAGREATPGGLE